MEKKILTTLLSVVILSATFTSCLREDDFKLPFTTFTPVNLNDGWEISMPAEQGICETELEDIFRYVHENPRLWQVRSLLVFRNNKLVAESYTKNPAEITQPVPIWSCTKQIMGILTGIAIKRGYIDCVTDNIQKYLPEEINRFPQRGSITIQNLLQMQSGIRFYNDGFGGGANQLAMQRPDNSLDFVLGMPTLAQPGERFHYNDGDPHLLSVILQRQTGKTTRDWAYEVLFSRIGMKNYYWEMYRDGITLGGNGISATPREMARMGHLVLNNGYWNGQQIVNSAWIQEMTSVKVSREMVNFYGFSWGYQWWIDESRGVVFMWGLGGQFVLVKPKKNLVMITTSDPVNRNQFWIDRALGIFDRIVSITN